VRFEHVSVTAMVPARSGASRPTLLNTAREALRRMLLPPHVRAAALRPFPMLRDASGVLCPGRLTLLLGSPGCGKSSLLRVLAGSLAKRAGLRVEGGVTFNGRPLSSFVPPRAAALVGQADVHIGELTVRETLDFAARCQGADQRAAELRALLAAEAAQNGGRAPDGAGMSAEDAEVDVFLRAMAVKGQRHHVGTGVRVM
jgi:ABC-type uncharacterized transport system YnjBCD ATPase subunit